MWPMEWFALDAFGQKSPTKVGLCAIDLESVDGNGRHWGSAELSQAPVSAQQLPFFLRRRCLCLAARRWLLRPRVVVLADHLIYGILVKHFAWQVHGGAKACKTKHCFIQQLPDELN